jgi:hypothetical protein
LCPFVLNLFLSFFLVLYLYTYISLNPLTLSFTFPFSLLYLTLTLSFWYFLLFLSLSLLCFVDHSPGLAFDGNQCMKSNAKKKKKLKNFFFWKLWNKKASAFASVTHDRMRPLKQMGGGVGGMQHYQTLLTHNIKTHRCSSHFRLELNIGGIQFRVKLFSVFETKWDKQWPNTEDFRLVNYSFNTGNTHSKIRQIVTKFYRIFEHLNK